MIPIGTNVKVKNKEFSGEGIIVDIDMPESKLFRYVVKFDNLEMNDYYWGLEKGMNKMNDDSGICVFPEYVEKIGEKI